MEDSPASASGRGRSRGTLKAALAVIVAAPLAWFTLDNIVLERWRQDCAHLCCALPIAAAESGIDAKYQLDIPSLGAVRGAAESEYYVAHNIVTRSHRTPLGYGVWRIHSSSGAIGAVTPLARRVSRLDAPATSDDDHLSRKALACVRQGSR